jgi:hypothetical protein
LITEAQLYAALVRREADGKRLGSYLIEKGFLTTDQVALALAEQVGLPPALEADFARADPALRRRFGAHQAVELQAVPLFVTGSRRVAVALASPSDPQILDKLTFILGATVEPMVASDVAIERQLDLMYSVPRRCSTEISVSVVDVPFLPSSSSSSSLAPLPPLLFPPPSPPVPSRPTSAKEAAHDSEVRLALRAHRRAQKTVRLVPLSPGAPVPESGAPVSVMEDAACFTPTPLTFIPPVHLHTPPTPTRVAARHPLTPIVVPMTLVGTDLAVEQIRYASDQQDVSDSLFTFMRACFGVGAMFSVAGTTAQGRFGFCDGLVCPEVEALTVSLSLPSCFRIARSRRTLFRGAPPPDGMAVHRALWAALRCEPPSDVLVSPVIVDGLVTLLLYAHGEGRGRIDSVAASHMERVCHALSSSLLRLAV